MPVEGIEIDITGFSPVEVDFLAEDHEESKEPGDELAAIPSGPAVSASGDLWLLGKHRLLCGNARSAADLDTLMASRLAAMVIADAPYNVRVADVVGRGRIKHEEFREGSGEMSEGEFQSFLAETLGNAARVTRDGGLHYVFMDWRHTGEVLAAGRAVYPMHVATVVWVKTNAGQGSFYRSQHEFVHVFRVGRRPHTNNIELGKHGRSRSNVWRYGGANSFGPERLDDLRAHPTVKPVKLLADAMKDCTKRSDLVLDPFCGSGSTLLAAERVGRTAYGLEIEPRYVDVAIRRWQTFTRRDAVHAATAQTFDERAE